jgi:hypothetical protein
MVNPVVEARVAEAALRLRQELGRNSGWLRRNRREQALREYLAEVVAAHYAAMCEQMYLPSEEQAETLLAGAIEHAVFEANSPEVENAAARYDAELARLWRVGYTAERARRWKQWQADPRPPHTTPEREAHEAQARAEPEELARRRKVEREQEAECAAPAEGGDYEVTAPAEGEAEKAAEVERRRRLLREYKEATGTSEYGIYSAAGRDHSCHKPEFRQWKRGELPADSATALSLERFLAAKKPPSTRKRKFSPR